ncbi:MAG TPA: bifunctional demethylmenaquinone methyltransferase/2-methoxy-6-polyprenyl-1,4-benzoquinol methylase, partial [Bacteroidetes bacterium]|nr:bifunctional demethylmenaquinone methyltransferase/2-methoxy-6-polyprenyl-1,4-benzoquinol methylase [Bacteroidota bacterium]
CPMVGRLVSGDARAYTYLYESVQVFPDGTAFTSIMETCGYKSIQWKKFTFGICSMYIGVK